jgi:hypothetical protein
MKHYYCILSVALAAAGCASATAPEVSSEQGEVGIFFGNAPDGVNCISFTLANEDGSTARFQFELPASNVRVIRNLTIGAYELSAVAYQAPVPEPISNADCEAVPLDAPWSTQAPVPVIVQTNRRSNIDLTLLPAGRIGVTVHWFQAPEVIAQRQGAVGAMVANSTPFGTFVAWGIAAQGGPTGRVMAMTDFPFSVPFTLIDALPNPGELAIDADFNTVYVQNFVTGTRDSEGRVISDGAIANDLGIQVSGINPGDLGFALTNHTAYWVGMAPNAGVGAPVPFNIDCFPCSQPLATNQVGANGLTAHGNRVFWGNNDGSLQGMTVTDPAPTTLASIAPRQAYGASADDEFLYVIDVDPRLSISASKIERVPVAGGPVVTLVDGVPGGAFPIVAFHGFVYFLAADGIKRVLTTGGPVELVTAGAIGGFALATDALGHDVIYWSDVTHGGLIWRGRL